MNLMAKKRPTKSPKPLNQDRATAALIFGVLAIVTFIVWFLGLLFGLLAIAFALGALRAKQDAARAVAGMTLGIVGLALTMIVMLVLTIATPKTHESQTDTDRGSEMTSLARQISNVVSDGKKATVEPSALSIQGFKVIKSIGSNEPATKTNVLFVGGKFCDGTVGQNDYSITVLMDDGSPYCTGFKQT